MSKREKLLEKAKNSPSNLRFSEVCKLAEYYGWVFDRQNGTSHMIYVNESLAGKNHFMMNFQDRKGRAKPPQVRELLSAIEELEERE
jgi:hypothetical protein